MMKNSKYVYPLLILFFLLAILGYELILGVIISLIFGKISFVLLKIAFVNSLFLTIGMFFNFYALNYLISKMKVFLILLLSFLIIFGMSIIGFVYIVFDEPLFFFYETNFVYSYLLINFLFILTISSVMTVVFLLQKAISEKDKKIREEKLLRREIEEKLYISKINPHFLFNSLSLIISLLKNPKKAEKALLSLSDLLRENINASNKRTVSISEELESVEKYLYIQKLRFEERLSYEIIKEKDFNIPPLIIQPLVENSIKHNIEHEKNIFITVKIYEENNENVIEVGDSARALKNESIGAGIGLLNTKSRVELGGGIFTIKDGIIFMRFKK